MKYFFVITLLIGFSTSIFAHESAVGTVVYKCVSNNNTGKDLYEIQAWSTSTSSPNYVGVVSGDKALTIEECLPMVIQMNSSKSE